MSKDSDQYEEVARILLNRMHKEFGLERVEGKQDIEGLRSGTSWEIDAKGIREGDGAIIIVECRRYTSSQLKQEHLGGLAYRILDTGVVGGITVSRWLFKKALLNLLRLKTSLTFNSAQRAHQSNSSCSF
jgi:hypothetical protein